MLRRPGVGNRWAPVQVTRAAPVQFPQWFRTCTEEQRFTFDTVNTALHCRAMSNSVNTADPGESDASIGVRLPSHLLDRIDARRAELASKSPGVTFTRSDIVRALILAGLAATDD